MELASQEIKKAIDSIPRKKEDLRKAFEAVQSYSSALASFTLQWRHLEDHLCSIQSSIDARFRDLQSLESSSSKPPATTDADADAADSPSSPPLSSPEPEMENPPRPELLTLSRDMDGKGLRYFMIKHRRSDPVGREELISALRSAPDPALLVLDALDGFLTEDLEDDNVPSRQIIRRTCINLLQRALELGPEIRESAKERAKNLVMEWKEKVLRGGDNLKGHAFLLLLAVYGLVGEFEVDEVFDVVALITKRKQAIELCRALGLTEHIPDLIQKLNTKGKHIDAAKFIHGFNLMDKYPLVPLLKLYLKETRKAVQEVLKKGNNSSQSMKDATMKELRALRSVMKAIKDYDLESVYPCENIEKRIALLEQQKSAEKKRTSSDAAVSNRMGQQQQESKKRPRPLTDNRTSAIASCSQKQTNRQPQQLTATPTPAAASYPQGQTKRQPQPLTAATVPGIGSYLKQRTDKQLQSAAATPAAAKQAQQQVHMHPRSLTGTTTGTAGGHTGKQTSMQPQPFTSNTMPAANNKQQHYTKQPRQLNPLMRPAAANNPHPSFIPNRPHFSMGEQSPYMGSASAYATAAPSCFFGHVGPNFPVRPAGTGGMDGNPYLYQSHGPFDRPGPYGGSYPMSGFSAPYGGPRFS